MSFKRAILAFVTVAIAFFICLSLFGSLKEPQVQSRLDLYQTNIILKASEWQGFNRDDGNGSIVQTLIDGKPIENAITAYEEAEKTGQASLKKIEKQIQQAQKQQSTLQSDQPILEQLEVNRIEQENFLAQLDLDLGILQAKQGNIDRARTIWQQLESHPHTATDFVETAGVLQGLWSQPSRLLPNAGELIETNLDGWFRTTALLQLYTLQQRTDAIAQLKTQVQTTAENAVIKLFAVSIVPYFAGLIGLGLIIFLLVQRLIKGQQAILAQNSQMTWTTPWDGYRILEVLVIGFFLVGQFIAPIFIQSIFKPALQSLTAWAEIKPILYQAILVFTSYLFVAFSAISFLFYKIRNYQPLTEDWFQFRWSSNWVLWGIGGYCTALPIVVIVSLINQQIWQGLGGSNPLLELVLDGNDTIALSLFFGTAAIAAPLFEELLFRGFLLPSLTRYMPVWGAILTSSLVFAIAHLSISEILPLFALGVILGIVYTRSRNLLAPMLLHALWNAGTMVTLLVLGSGN